MFELFPVVHFVHTGKFVQFHCAVFEGNERCLVINPVSNIGTEQAPVLYCAIGNVDPARVWSHVNLKGNFVKTPDNYRTEVNRDERRDQYLPKTVKWRLVFGEVESFVYCQWFMFRGFIQGCLLDLLEPFRLRVPLRLYLHF